MKRYDVYYTMREGLTTYVHTVDAINAISAKWVAAEEMVAKLKYLELLNCEAIL